MTEKEFGLWMSGFLADKDPHKLTKEQKVLVQTKLKTVGTDSNVPLGSSTDWNSVSINGTYFRETPHGEVRVYDGGTYITPYGTYTGVTAQQRLVAERAEQNGTVAGINTVLREVYGV